jgi:hypothetical protein
MMHLIRKADTSNPVLVLVETGNRLETAKIARIYPANAV